MLGELFTKRNFALSKWLLNGPNLLGQHLFYFLDYSGCLSDFFRCLVKEELYRDPVTPLRMSSNVSKFFTISATYFPLVDVHRAVASLSSKIKVVSTETRLVMEEIKVFLLFSFHFIFSLFFLVLGLICNF